MNLFKNLRSRDRLTIAISGGVLVILMLATILGPWIGPYSFDEQNISNTLQGPSLQHWAGTDVLGRDLLAQILSGGRTSLTVGVATALIALALGALAGTLAGLLAGWWDATLMFFIDFFSILPSLLLATLLTLTFGRGLSGIVLAIGLTTWVTQARLVRGLTLQLKALPFVEAARSVGLTTPRLIWRHLLPNMTNQLLLSIAFQIPQIILTESFLSFVGLGLKPPHSSWGTLASEGFQSMRAFPHLMIFPGAVLFLALLSFQYLGEGLRRVMDPTQSIRD